MLETKIFPKSSGDKTENMEQDMLNTQIEKMLASRTSPFKFLHDPLKDEDEIKITTDNAEKLEDKEPATKSHNDDQLTAIILYLNTLRKMEHTASEALRLALSYIRIMEVHQHSIECKLANPLDHLF